MVLKNVVVDKNKCIGCGACVSVCPKVFRLNDEGKSEAFDSAGASEEEIQQAMDACPTQAISWG